MATAAVELAPGWEGAPIRRAAASASCRVCGAALTRTVLDLGMSPLCESFLTAERLDREEVFYPLTLRLCGRCSLVQLPAYVLPEQIFSEYAYFSSYSDSWVAHARAYVDEVVERLGLTSSSSVVEIGSNDGYLLQHFAPHGIPVLGVEPAANVGREAERRGVPTLQGFFGRELARRLALDQGRADLVIGNNVLAQVPDLHDFLSGVQILLAPGGLASFEFPSLQRLLDGLAFDTIYHEHFSYFSLTTAREAFRRHGLEVVDVDELATHGGSFRVWARHAGEDRPSGRVAEVLAAEAESGLCRPEAYADFANRVADVKNRLLDLLIGLRRDGASVAGYGAPGKANTLLNYCGIRADLLPFTVDRNPYKHGLFLPGTHIPVLPPERLTAARPDVIVILPWNLREEILAQLEPARAWGARFVIPIPEVEVVE